jgi:3'(2'), 5'-bisphosphate nucleotidase
MKIYELDDHSVTIKKDLSPLTQADIASHNSIVSSLSASEIPVLSEEAAQIGYNDRKAWNRLWIVDPLDGTKEFINRNGEFTVNIALIENRIPVLGVIYVPVQQTVYYGARSKGSFKTEKVQETSTAEELVSKSEKLPLHRTKRNYTIVGSRSHMNKETKDFINEIRRQKGEIEFISKGSSLKLCLVAEGSADCYPRYAPTMEWDIAAGHAICKYAGITVLDLISNKEMEYNRENLKNNWFMVKD